MSRRFNFTNCIYPFLIFSFFFNFPLRAQDSPWSTRSALPIPKLALSSTVFDDKIYAIGGVTEGSEIDIYGCGAIPIPKMHVYDPVTDTWDTTKAEMHTGRNSFASCIVNGKIYAIGGQSISCYENLASIEVYDPVTNTWDTTKAAMPEKRAGLSASVVKNKIYVIGGWNYFTPMYRRAVMEYDPVTNTWDTTRAQIPKASAYLATSVVDEKIYVFGGQKDDESFDSRSLLQIYDPASDTWDTTKTAMPAARSFIKSAVVNNLIYLFGGTTNFYSGSPMDNVWVYNTVTDTYKVLTSIPTGIVQFSIGTVNGRIYLIGGLSNVWPLDSLQFIDNVLEYNPVIIDAIANSDRQIFNSFTLYQNYPNPFNPKTVISYALPVTCHLDLSIYNLLGQKVATLVNKKQPAGGYKVEWDATDFSSGVYIYQIRAGEYNEVKKMILLK